MNLRDRVSDIERRRGSRVLVLAASNLETDLLPALYDTLREIGRTERLDVLLRCHGGEVTAARAIALLLHQFTGHLAFIVPDRCTSSATILALSGHEIVAGPAALFSPVDPLLEGAPSASGDGLGAISAQDVRLFGAMSRDWFGVPEGEAGAKALSVLCENVFPTTLTSFYRSTLEVEAVCLELLSLHMDPGSAAEKKRIVDSLLYGHHSHGFALMRGDLAALGLPVRGDPETEDCAWEAARALRECVGGGSRRAPEDDWTDALLATRSASRRRRRSREGTGPVWESGDSE
ncbi:MAG: hypothetical protein QOJ91_2838 [Sphingomonadales bacterium]|jgi:hypothetical protein|nr:hypothetical protein [Sphingomonadales bacterium]